MFGSPTATIEVVGNTGKMSSEKDGIFVAEWRRSGAHHIQAKPSFSMHFDTRRERALLCLPLFGLAHAACGGRGRFNGLKVGVTELP